MVPKPSGGWRACGDYRALNAVSEDDRYPIPHKQDFAVNLIGTRVFSKVDLVRAYNQVPMNADDIAKTAIVAPFGLFVYLRMLFGLKNAAQTFQRFMDNAFRDMQFVYVYLDDILVASSSTEEHCIHLRQLFERLSEYGLVVNPQKCVLGESSLDFLGHQITSDGIHPLQDRVQAIRDYPQSRTAKSLKEYLGLLNFYRRFVPHAAAILLPLYELVSLKDIEFYAAWTSLHERHFQQSKDALAAATCLAHPSPTAETHINTDASDTAVGAVLRPIYIRRYSERDIARYPTNPISDFYFRLCVTPERYRARSLRERFPGGIPLASRALDQSALLFCCCHATASDGACR